MRYLLLIAALCACHGSDTSGTTDSGGSTSDGNGNGSGSGSGSGSSGSMNGQTISCYSQGAPSATCTLPTHCCFSNFSSQHDGSCGTSTCTWGTIECDGPEDCTNGGHCCSKRLADQDGTYGYRIACQASACEATPTGEELCHPGGPACSNGGSCVTASGANNDLPRSLSICR